MSRLYSSITFVGLGSQSSNRSKGFVHFKIKPYFSSDFESLMSAHILPSLTTSLPSSEISTESWSHLKDLQLADPQFSVPENIDIIIGADFYRQILNEGLVKGPDCTPIAQYTNLGWIVFGPTEADTSLLRRRSYHVSYDEGLCKLMQRFWELESVPTTSQTTMTAEEAECEEHFKKTHSRDLKGRYIVKLPFKDSVEKLGLSKGRAILLHNKLVKRFSTDSEYTQAYSAFMREYEQLNHMRPVQNLAAEPSCCYYLPHHGIWKQTSLSTKLRVVYNGSSPTSSGYSLNDILHTGAKLQTDIFEVLLWFRQFRFVFSADIEKMFRQINQHEDDWKYQRIIWHNQRLEPVIYELTTVTYGLVCAPFLSLRVLQQLILDEGEKFPMVVTTMVRGRYVDDLFGGADSIFQVQELVNQVNQLCKAGGFTLKKWISNEDSVLNSILNTNRLESTNLLIDDNTLIHSLGLSWRPLSDNFHFIIGISTKEPVIKRIMLSEISKIFDPLGFLSPVTITAKLLIQELWVEKVDWDKVLPLNVVQRWTEFMKYSQELSKLEFPRWIGMSASGNLEIHGFCDASLKAMTAVVFCRNISSDGQISIQFVCAKTKVAPLKRLTIPRLELTGAVLLTKLVARVITTLQRQDIKVYLWTDSTITLTWITGHPAQWKDFVHNRVVFIQDTLPMASWRFVPGTDNPADLATRGVTPSQLSELITWWHGPAWLTEPPQYWPSAPFVKQEEAHLEKRSVKKSSSLVRLIPFIDSNGILRVGGRFGSSNLTYEAKHPAILPKKSAFTTR